MLIKILLKILINCPWDPWGPLQNFPWDPWGPQGKGKGTETFRKNQKIRKILRISKIAGRRHRPEAS